MKLFLFSTLFTILFSQTTVLSLSGLGEEKNETDPVNAGAGHIRIFSASVNGTSHATTALLWKDMSTGLRTTINFQNLSSEAFSNFFTNGINHISFNFPIGKGEKVQIGLLPRIWSQYSVREEINADSPVLYFDEHYYRYKSNYYSRGGLSSLFGTYSRKVTNYYSFGIKLESIFGNRLEEDSLEVYNYHLDEYGEEVYSLAKATITNSFHHYQGYSLNIEQIFTTSRIDVGLSVNLGGPLYVELQDYFTTGIGKTDLETYTYNNIYTGLGIGVHSKLKDNFGLIIESSFTQWNEMRNEHIIFKTQNPDKWCINFGSYIHFINQDKGRISSATLRAGFYYNNFTYPDNIIVDYGITLGSGLRFNGQFNSVDIAFAVGNRHVNVYNIEYEKYINLVIGLDIGENWFLTKR